jgi:hypothetical protein
MAFLEKPNTINLPKDNVYNANWLIVLKRFFDRKRASRNMKKGHTSNKFSRLLLASNRRTILPRRYNLL